MTKDFAAKPWKLNSGTTRTLLIGAQALALIVFILALIFLWSTTGGTLFVFSTIAPALALLATIAVLGVAVYRFLRRRSLFEVEDFGPGREIFHQGEEGDCAYFIQSGEVEVSRQEEGVQRVIATLSKGQYFGEMALISNAPRNATVRSLTPIRMAILGKQNFLTMLSIMPQTQEDIMQTVNMRAMSNVEK